MPFKFLTKSQMKAKQLPDLCSLSTRSVFPCFGELIAHILLTSGNNPLLVREAHSLCKMEKEVKEIENIGS